MPRPTIDPRAILSRDETGRVLAYLAARRTRSAETAQNEIIFRLATCYGLRATEIAHLTLGDVQLASDHPTLTVATLKQRRRAAKRRRPDPLDLSISPASIVALTTWVARRRAAGATARSPLVCVQKRTIGRLGGREARARLGAPLTRQQICRRFRTACRCLGPERAAQLHTHVGRHTCATYVVQSGDLAFARDLLRHSSVAITDIYIGCVPGSRAGLMDVLEPAPPPPPPPADPTSP